MAIDKALMSELKEKLLGEKSHLEAELLVLAKPTGSAGDYETRMEEIGTDPDENATEVEGYVDNLGLETNLEGQLKDVTDALAKMDQGTYGVCEKTGEEISVDRLKVYPAARTAL
ncbi:MAG: TraR/DksA C4-type zinc finger protein [Candidatus Moranbacteria bacterium]|nr:TraR/DksA C4-type zinc finger protein [Candidatus Moranbacteria bacterium]